MMGFAGPAFARPRALCRARRLCHGGAFRPLRHLPPWLGMRRGHGGGGPRRHCHRRAQLPLRRHRRLFRAPHHRLRRIHPHPLRSSRLVRRLERAVPAGANLAARRPRAICAARLSMFYYLLLAMVRRRWGSARACCAGASATTGRPSARTRRPRAALGINVFRYKLAAVALSAVMTAVAGTVLAFYYNNLYPDTVFADRQFGRASSRHRSSAASAPCSDRSWAPSS